MKPIYVHGLGQTPADWKQTIRYLALSENVICPSITDFAHGIDVSYQNLYRMFSDTCSSLGERLDLCGLSLGGVMALNYAIEHPENVNSLVLIAARYKTPKNLLRFQNAILHLMPNSMFAQTGFCKAEVILLCKSMSGLDFSRSLAKISCPTLVVCGGKDSANKNASIKLADRLQNAKLCLLDDVGHEVNREAPERLAEQIQAFYKGIE